MKYEEFKRWSTAYHEAGHLIATHYSKHFSLKDPAVRLRNVRDGNLAEATVRGIRQDMWELKHVRECSVISFGGYVGERILEDLYPGRFVHPESCDGDASIRQFHLQRFHITHEESAHLKKCNRLIDDHKEEHKRVAELIYRSDDDIPLAAVMALLNPKPVGFLARVKKALGFQTVIG